MSCEKVQEHLVEYVLGELPNHEALRVEQHLATPCAVCQREEISIREALEGLYEVMPSITMDRAEVERVAKNAMDINFARQFGLRLAGKASNDAVDPIKPSSLHGKTLRKFAQLVGALAAGFVVVLFSFPKESSTEIIGSSNTEGEVAVEAPTPNQTPTFGSMSTARTSDQSSIKLVANGVNKSWQGVCVLDAASRELHFIGYGLPPLATDVEYVLVIQVRDGTIVQPVEFQRGIASCIAKIPSSEIKSIRLFTSDSSDQPEDAMMSFQVEI